MVLFNTFAIKVFPVECTLVALQLLVTVVGMSIFCFNFIKIDSFYDILGWAMVVPLVV